MDITVVVVCGRTHGLVRILTPRSMITNKAYYSSTFFGYNICTARVNGFCSAADDAIRTKGLHLTPIYRIHVLLSTIQHFDKNDSLHFIGTSDMTPRASD